MKPAGPKIYFVFLLLLAIFHLFGNSIWIALNNTPPAWDQAYHTTKSLEIYQFLSGKSGLETLITSLSDFYAPLVKIFTAVFLFLIPADDPVKMAQFPGTLFFIATLVIIFLLASEISKNYLTGIIAAFLFSFFQIVYDNSRWLLLDVPLTFFVTTSIYFLIKSELLQRRNYSILAFILVSLSILTKVQAIIYLIFPILWIVIKLVKQQEKTYKYLLWGSLISFIIILPWVLLSYKNIIFYFSIASHPETTDPVNLFDSITWFYYPKIIINHVLTFFVFLFSILPIYTFIRSKNPYKIFIFLFITFYCVLFTLFSNKDIRFLYPTFPFLAIIIASGFLEIQLISKLKFLALFIPIILINIILYFSLSFSLLLPRGINNWVMIPKFGDISFLNTTNFPVRGYGNESWPNRQLIKDIFVSSKGNPVNPVLIPNFDQFNDNNLRMYIAETGLNNIQIARAGGRDKFPNDTELVNYVNQYKYFIYTDGEFGPPYQIDAEAFTQLQKKIKQLWSENQFILVNSYILPTGQNIYLLKRSEVYFSPFPDLLQN